MDQKKIETTSVISAPSLDRVVWISVLAFLKYTSFLQVLPSIKWSLENQSPLYLYMQNMQDRLFPSFEAISCMVFFSFQFLRDQTRFFPQRTSSVRDEVRRAEANRNSSTLLPTAGWSNSKRYGRLVQLFQNGGAMRNCLSCKLLYRPTFLP